MAHSILVINGPNLNLLGTRQPEIYGGQTFESYYKVLQNNYPNVTFTYVQSNIEGELIDALQQAGKETDAVILNAAAYTHTSVGIGDAVKAIVYTLKEFEKNGTELKISSLNEGVESCKKENRSWKSSF